MKFGLSVSTIQAINDVFTKYPHVEKAILYGSRATGNYRNGSDIDLTLVGSALTEHDVMRIRCEFDDMLTPYSFDLSILQNINNPDLIDHIYRVGRVFYQRIA